MGKVLKIFTVVAGLALAFVPGVGAAFTSAIIGLGGGTFAAAGVAFALKGVLILAGGLMAAGMVGGLFRKNPDLTSAMYDRLKKNLDPDPVFKWAFGQVAFSTDLIFQERYGSKSDQMVEVYALAGHRISAVQSVYFDNELTWNGSAFTGKYATGMVSARAVTEGTAGTALALGSGSYWTTAARATGIARLELVYNLNPKKWGDGALSPPQRVTFIGKGSPVYDPRLDSTRGGSGSHRADDRSTWEYAHGGTDIGRNPALCLLAYLLGWKISTTFVLGRAIPPALIDFSSFITYASLCEESVVTAAGGTVQRYTCDILLSDADDHETNIRNLLGCMGTVELTDDGGIYALSGGYDDTLTDTVVLTEDDLIGGYEWSPAPGIRERHTGVTGRFPNPSKLYVPESWGNVNLASLYADGIPRLLQLDLPGVTRWETAQRIAKQILLADTVAGSFTAVFGPRMFAAKVGSLIELSLSPEGWNGKLFRVTSMAQAHDLMFRVTAREVSADVYEWDAEETAIPTVTAIPAYDPTETVTPAGLAVTGRTVTGSNGLPVQFADVTWTAETSQLVAGIQIETKVSTATGWEIATDGLIDASLALLTVLAPAGVTVQARARYRMVSGVYGPYATTVSGAIPATEIDSDALADNAVNDPPTQLQSSAVVAITGTAWKDVGTFKLSFASVATTDVISLSATCSTRWAAGVTNMANFRLAWRLSSGSADTGALIGTAKYVIGSSSGDVPVDFSARLTGVSGSIEVWLQVQPVLIGIAPGIPAGMSVAGCYLDGQRVKK